VGSQCSMGSSVSSISSYRDGIGGDANCFHVYVPYGGTSSA